MSHNVNTTVAHSFIDDDTKRNNDEKVNENIAIVVLGNTGVGKSSLVNLFCGNNVIIGHGVQSQTKQSKLFQDKTNPNRYWLDSQGINDSDGIDDEKVLKDILKKLYDSNISSVKIIWCIDSGDICRAGADTKTQAKFIKSFNKQDIWKSCLIIKKKGSFGLSAGLDGVIASANTYGADIKYGDKRLFGYSYLNQINVNDTKQIDKTLKVIMFATKPNTQKRHNTLKMAGYLSNELIKNEVNLRLSQLSTSSLEFKHQKCTKCGYKGDERYIYEPCHIAPELYHPRSTKQYHPSSVEYKHRRSSVLKETHSTNYNDPYHPGSKRSGRWTCCGGVTETRWVWSSFTVEMASSGCEHRTYVSNSWWEYPCCGRHSSATGCVAEYKCCKGNLVSTGCVAEYQCCDKGPNDKGCKTRCCNVQCKTIWGKGPGCMKTTKMIEVCKEMKIYIRIRESNGNYFVLNVEPDDIIETIKDKIHKLNGYDVKKQKLIFRAKMLMNDQSLCQRNIINGCTLFLILT